MNYHQLKLQLLEQAAQLLQEKIVETVTATQSAKESRDNDTKSSAGDKYETGREMMQMEINKNEAQLAKYKLNLHEIENLKKIEVNDKVAYGSLVITNKGMYYFGLALGKMLVSGNTIYALSLASPIGKAFNFKVKGDGFTFNSIQYKIEGIY